MDTNWIYSGIFLDGESSDKLKTLFAPLIPQGWKIFCHHETLVFNNHSPEVEEYFQKLKDEHLGEEITLTATGFGISDRAIAVSVVSPLMPFSSKIPHITIAVAPGAKPVESNYISTWKELDNPIILKGKVDFFQKR